jgi:Transcription factor WhiB
VADGWWNEAACRGRDPQWWSGDRLMATAAVAICLTCPVREPCLEEALATGDYGVIRGGILVIKKRSR